MKDHNISIKQKYDDIKQKYRRTRKLSSFNFLSQEHSLFESDFDSDSTIHIFKDENLNK